MKVKVKTLADIWEVVGRKREFMVDLPEGSTVMDLINELIGLYGEPLKKILLDADTKGLSDSILILVNRTEMKNDDVNKRILKDGDEVILMPPVVGGTI
jgi:MoaD family protein